MKIGFRLLPVVTIVLGISLGGGLIGCQPAQQPVAGAAASNAGASATPSSGGRSAPQRGGAPATGTVASVGDKQFSLKSQSSATPIVVHIDDQTTIRKQVAGTLSDVKPGERITVRGETQADGTVAATTVQIAAAEGGSAASGVQGQTRGQRMQSGTSSGSGTRPQGTAGMLTGTVKEVADNVVSVARSGGSGTEETVVKVTLSDKTSVTKTVAGEVKDIAEGAYVMASGSRGADGAITATSVQILPPDAAGTTSTQ